METIIGQQFLKKVVPIIDQTKNSLKIVVFDWRWYGNDPGNPVQIFNQAIVRAVRRGVKIEVIGNSEPVLRTLRSVGVQARKIVSKNLVHAKMIIIDDRDVIVGSHNFTYSAFTKNHEVSLYIQAAPQAQELINYFHNLWLC